jgi:hypothetical protein
MEEQVSTARIALKYGVLTGVANMVYSTIINVAGLSQNKALASLSYIFLIVGIVLAMKAFREENRGFMSYGEGLGLGSLASAVMGLLGGTYIAFYNKFIDSTLMEQAMNKVQEDLEAKGMDDAQIETAMQFSRMFTSPGALFLIGVIGSLVIGFIVSLIVAAILRKDKPVFD